MLYIPPTRLQGCYKLEAAGENFPQVLWLSRGKRWPHSWCFERFPTQVRGIPRTQVWPVGGVQRAKEQLQTPISRYVCTVLGGMCRPAVLSGGDFIPQGTFGNIWRHFCHTGGGCHWHLVSAGQGHYSHSRPPPKEDLSSPKCHKGWDQETMVQTKKLKKKKIAEEWKGFGVWQKNQY